MTAKEWVHPGTIAWCKVEGVLLHAHPRAKDVCVLAAAYQVLQVPVKGLCAHAVGHPYQRSLLASARWGPILAAKSLA